MIVVVTASRDLTDPTPVRAQLEELHRRYTITWLLEGGAGGGDQFAKGWAKERGLPQLTCEYASAYGKQGGGIRNGWLLEAARHLAKATGDSVLVLAFPAKNSIGTWNCVTQAKANGMNIRVVRL